MSSSQQATASKLDLPLLVDELFLVLTPKEKEVITKRFSLDAKPRMTLESIGRKFSVTRERVRQIEKIALTKLRRTVQSSKLIEVDALIDGIIETYGGICTEKTIITEILGALKLTTEVDGNIIRLALNINPAVVKAEKSNELAPFWRKKEIPIEDIYKIIEVAIARLNEQNDVVPEDQLAEQIRNKMLDGGKQFSKLAILSALDADMRIKKTKEGLGLATWRHINPKSIRDKAYIVLKKHGQPLHFVEIANKIIEYGFDKKIVTVQAVHNELIRYDQFVLVGRGLYALKEWGYKKGTVAEIIEGLLAKRSPLTKAEIITGVLKQRKVKKGTISLNLQKNPHFVRVGRAVYSLKK